MSGFLDFLAPCFDLYYTIQSCIVLASSRQLLFSCSDSSPILLPLVPLFPPRRVDLLVPPTEKREGRTSLLLLELLICCSARNTAHVGDLYPASSKSSLQLVSFSIERGMKAERSWDEERWQEATCGSRCHVY